jgi:polysaccharide deacetylase family protein (PEP-CTERM system associated)
MTMQGSAIRNAMTVDVEDYYHVAAFSDVVREADWSNFESRVERNTNVVLSLFAERNVKATFFVLGWVAERHPQIVRQIHAQGHEIACHGYSHRLVFRQSPQEFKSETLKSKQIIEDAAGVAVLGYRASTYSIVSSCLWALDVLVEAGFKYDSSIFPVRHDVYGIPGSQTVPHKLRTPQGAELVEFPLTAADLVGAKLPVAGGGYFRLFPYALSHWGLSQMNNRARAPFVFYLHPWEVDPGQPRIAGRLSSRLRHYNNLSKCVPRLKRLLGDFRFGTMRESLADYGLAL